MRRRAAVLASAVSFACTPGTHAATCPPRGHAIVVETGQHRLWTCEDGRAAGEYDVALGSGGLGKTQQGDAKVPLGDYALGQPRGSSQFHKFIPNRIAAWVNGRGVRRIVNASH